MLSVVVPMYNSSEYIRECLDSILEQSYKDIEVIVVDDGSEDDSLSIVEEYTKKDNRVFVLSQNNMGPSVARFNGVKASRGEYITFVDADDFIAADSYIYAEADMDSGVDVVSFGIYRFHSKDNIVLDCDAYEEKVYDKAEIKKIIQPNMVWDTNRNKNGLDPSLCNKIFKRCAIEQAYEGIGKIDFHYGEDVVILYPLIKGANSISVHRKSYYYHRIKTEYGVPSYIKDDNYLDKLYKMYTCLINGLKDDCYKKQIDLFYAHSVLLIRKKYELPVLNEIFVFPFDRIQKGARIVVYGAGEAGKSYVHQLKETNYCQVLLWVDSNNKNYDQPEKIFDVDYDYVVIAIMNEKTREIVEDYLLENGVPADRIV